jgi:hypothetical protein
MSIFSIRPDKVPRSGECLGVTQQQIPLYAFAYKEKSALRFHVA